MTKLILEHWNKNLLKHLKLLIILNSFRKSTLYRRKVWLVRRIPLRKVRQRTYQRRKLLRNSLKKGSTKNLPTAKLLRNFLKKNNDEKSGGWVVIQWIKKKSGWLFWNWFFMIFDLHIFLIIIKINRIIHSPRRCHSHSPPTIFGTLSSELVSSSFITNRKGYPINTSCLYLLFMVAIRKRYDKFLRMFQ